MYIVLMMVGRLKYSRDSLVSEVGAFDVEMVIEKVKRHKSSGIDQIPAELIVASSKIFRSEILKLFGISRNWEPG